MKNTSGKIMRSITGGFRGYVRDNVPTLSKTGVDEKPCKRTSLTDITMEDALVEKPLKDVRSNEAANGEMKLKRRHNPEQIESLKRTRMTQSFASRL